MGLPIDAIKGYAGYTCEAQRAVCGQEENREVQPVCVGKIRNIGNGVEAN
jgi:hypothetical protein